MFTLPTLISVTNIVKGERREILMELETNKDPVYQEVLQRKLSNINRLIGELDEAISSKLLTTLG